MSGTAKPEPSQRGRPNRPVSMSEDTKSKGTFRQWLSDRAIRAMLGVLLALPYRWRVPFCGWIVSRIVSPLARWPKRIRENLKLILPDLPEAEIDRMIRAVPNNIGRTLIEIYSGTEFIDRADSLPLTGPGVAALEAAQRQGRPAILATGHFGNYDAVRAALIRRGYPLGALYRPMSNPWFNDHYVRAISTIGTPVFERGRSGMAKMLKHLRTGGMIGILPDQRIDSGVMLSFFGVEAKTALSTAEMALKYNAVLIPTYAIRQADGLSFQIIVDTPIQPGSAEKMTQEINDSLWAYVRQYPDQWLWVHRRWR